MEQISINKVMDEFYEIVNSAPLEDVVMQLMRRAGIHGKTASLEALARLLAVENTRRRHAEALLKQTACPH